MKFYTAMTAAGVLALALSTSVSATGNAALEPAQIAAAKAAADHEAIAKAYEDEATELDGKVKMHEQMTDSYKSNGKMVGPARHCDALVKDFKAAAQESRLLAKEHRKLAEKAEK